MWISKPGIDVLSTTTEANFLFSSSRKVHQIVMSGRVYAAAGTSVDVFFPATFSTKRPYVYFNESQNGGLGQYPHDLNYGGVPGLADAACGCLIRSDRINFGPIGGNINDHFIDFIVFNTQIN